MKSPMLHRLLTLARVSNLPTVWSNCLAAWLIAGVAPEWRMLWLLAGASLLYAAGCTLNDAFDAKWDAQHRPERIIPSGALSRRAVWGIGLTEMAAGLGLIYAGGVSAWWPPVALAAGILLYDARHKQSPWSVVVMGACRWLLYVTAAAAAGGAMKPVMICGAVLWLYIIVLSLVARGEAKRGEGVPKSRWLLYSVPPALFVVAVLQGGAGYSLWIPAFIYVVCLSAVLPRKPDAPVGAWVNRLLAAIPLVDWCLFLALLHLTNACPAIPAVVGLSLAFPAAVVLSLIFQQRFQAT